MRPVYSYRLLWRTPVEGGRRITPHSLDLPFVFDNVDVAADMVGDPTGDTAALADAMSESWIAFARTGDPNNRGPRTGVGAVRPRPPHRDAVRPRRPSPSTTRTPTSAWR